MTASARLKLRSDGPRAWLMADQVTGTDVGGIRYEHAGDGNHYHPWIFIDGTRHDAGAPVPQLAMAARAVEAAVRRHLSESG